MTMTDDIQRGGVPEASAGAVSGSLAAGGARSAARALPDIARLATRTRNLIAQGLAETAHAPAAAQPLSDPYVELTDRGVALRGRDGDRPLDDAALAELAAVPPGPVDLVFSGASCFELSFGLPDSPLADLRAMMAGEVQARSPFADDAALTFWTAEEAPDRRWRVTAAVTLRAPTEALLARLAAHGVTVGLVRWHGGAKTFAARPDWIAPAGAAADAAFGTARWRDRLRQVPPTLRAAALGTAILAVSAAALLGQATLRHAAAAEAAAQARAELSQAAARATRLSALNDALARSAERLALTGTLSALLPDGVWLDQLIVEADTVTLVGFGPSAAEVTRLLSGLPQLSDIRFASPVTRDNSQSIERFRILATLDGDGA